MKVTYKESDNVMVDEEIYNAKVVKIELRKSKFGEQLKWQFEIIGHPKYEGVTVGGWTPDHPTRKNKLGKWLKKLGLDMESIAEGDDVELNDFIGKKIGIDVQNNEETGWSNVDSLRTITKHGAAADDDDDDDDEVPARESRRGVESKAKPKPRDEEEDEPKPKKRRAEPEEEEDEPKPKKKARHEEEEEEEEEPKPKKAKAKPEPEEEEDEPPRKKSKAKPEPEEDEEEEDEPRPKKGKKAKDDDDDF